jgi:hypothetical protein
MVKHSLHKTGICYDLLHDSCLEAHLFAKSYIQYSDSGKKTDVEFMWSRLIA